MSSYKQATRKIMASPICLQIASFARPKASGKSAICKQIGGDHDFTYRLFVRWLAKII